MKFQPARHTGPPNSKSAGDGGVSLAGVSPANATPSAPLNTSFAVNTSGEGGGTAVVAGAAKALPIVENCIGSQNTCTPTPIVRMSVWRMPLMRNVESMLATPGTLELPDMRFTVSPRV